MEGGGGGIKKSEKTPLIGGEFPLGFPLGRITFKLFWKEQARALRARVNKNTYNI